MTFGAGVLIVALALIAVLGLVVAWLIADRNKTKAEVMAHLKTINDLSAEIRHRDDLAKTVAKVEETRNDQKDVVASGGFAGSMSVLSDIASGGAKPKT